MKFSFSRLLILSIATTLLIPHAHAQVVEIPDPNLNQAVREALELPGEKNITQQEMRRLIYLPAENREITNLTGIEYAINLKELGLNFNQIQDITPLAGLVDLELLSLIHNPITDFSPLAKLIQLESLYLASIRITDLTPLSNLTQLRVLDLTSCREIRDITPLSNLTQLNRLEISHNQIMDISPLANLTQLAELRIDNNQVIDVSPLANLIQLTNLTLANNAITDFRPLFGLNLQSVDIDIHKLQELASGDVEIPDSNLESAIREELGLPFEIPLNQLVMSQLIELDAGRNRIETLTGLEYATNLRFLELSFNQIQEITPLAGLVNLELLALIENPIADFSPLATLTQLESLFLAGIRRIDLTPLSNLTQLKELYLGSCWIRDITPLSNLTQLKRLDLSSNQIVDIRPLANLTQLEELRIEGNQIVDFSPLQGLSLSVLTYDEFCLLPSTPIQERIVTRSLPSIVVGWHHSTIPLVSLSGDISRSNPERYAGIEGENAELVSYHDLFWGHAPFDLRFQQSPPWSKLVGNLSKAIARRERLLAKNPNMLFLVEIRHLRAHPGIHYSEDWFGWVRDINGIPISESRRRHSYMVNFTLPEVQDAIVGQAISVAQCGLYDGIFFDGWHEEYQMLMPRFGETLASPITFEQEKAALFSILQRIRESVPEDFLILCNSNWNKLPSSAPYINGGFMETGRDLDSGYSNDRLAEIEDTLIWFEENLREPKINCVQGQGISTERPDSPTNKRWMRFFTTMSLTLSDGYALYTTGHYYQDHIWYDFWDANLGQPIGLTAQPYENIEGLYIREFTNGWAVYNRSGQAQTVTLPATATPVSDRGNNAAAQTHLLPDLDGEIYLRAKNSADVNGDGKINILDLVQVANGLGKSAPDPNGDDVVNILDLVFVARQFSQ